MPLVLAMESRESKINAQVLFQAFKEIRLHGGTVTVDWPDAEGPIQFVFRLNVTRPIYSMDGGCWANVGDSLTLNLNYHLRDCCDDDGAIRE